MQPKVLSFLYTQKKRVWTYVHEEYTKANREVKKSIKADKRKYIDDMA